MKVELESLRKILSVCTLIDDKNGPISAREIRQLLKNYYVSHYTTSRDYQG